MAITSSSTLAQVKAQYEDNADYDVENDVAKCKLFIHACRVLLQRIPKRLAHGGRGADEVESDPEQLRLELGEAKAWLSANDATLADAAGGGGIIYTDFDDIRR